jgi:hypothetical protein
LEVTVPSPEEILAGLRTIANDWRWLAGVWHGYFGVLAFGLVLGVRPSRRTAGVLLALPLLSVSALSWIYANPFNGGVFALAGVALLLIALKLGGGAVRVGPRWSTVAGALMFTFGWVYPHFLGGATPAAWLYAAPTGLIPCPTLSIVIGATLVLEGLGSRSWCLVLAVVGLFYGVFGAFRLGVQIDLALLVGAVVMAIAVLSGRWRVGSGAPEGR